MYGGGGGWVREGIMRVLTALRGRPCPALPSIISE